jgi:hypothetical protein
MQIRCFVIAHNALGAYCCCCYHHYYFCYVATATTSLYHYYYYHTEAAATTTPYSCQYYCTVLKQAVLVLAPVLVLVLEVWNYYWLLL